MAIHVEQTVDISGGIKKEIEASAMDMMLDILQKSQYQYPIKSLIRELVSNGIDAVSEREVAKNILSGKNQVTDYFAEMEGDVYKDSRFDPNYYDLQWLDTDMQVHITYHEGKNEKDWIKISDNGIGIGGVRLEKYFNLGFSSKRLNKHSIGKFGIGNKSPLAIAEFYTVENRYNGKLFRFNVYNGKIESLIPALDLKSGRVNAHVEFKGGIKVYYQETTEKNGLSIFIDTKKHHRTQYVDAVKSQLLYFDNVDMQIVKEEGNIEHVNYKANIFFEDEQIILSDNKYWARPHLLINRVNYGFIDFEELELEEKTGNIGIKVDPELISINPSRESIRWDDKTKALVLEKFQSVVSTATKLVQEELQEGDFLKWLRICYQISARYQTKQDTIIGRLAGIIDITQVKPYFPKAKNVRFVPTYMFDGFICLHTHISKRQEANRLVTTLKREPYEYGIGNVIHLPVVYSTEGANVRRDKYLLHTTYKDGFLVIKPPSWLRKDGADQWTEEELITEMKGDFGAIEIRDAEKTPGRIKEIKDKAEALWTHLIASSDIKHYGSIEVPEDFKASDLDEEIEEVVTEEDKEVNTIASITAAERRKLEGKTVIHTPRLVEDYPYNQRHQMYEWQKLEIPFFEINQWKEEEIYFANGSEDDVQAMIFAACISRLPAQDTRNTGRVGENPDNSSWNNSEDWFEASPEMAAMGVNRSEAYRCCHFFDRPDLKLIKVAVANNRYYRDFKHISRFFHDIKNGTITMSSTLVKWNTARQLKEKLSKLSFLFNFPFDSERKNQYHKLIQYVKANYREVEENVKDNKFNNLTKEAYTDLLGHMEKVQQFQLFVAECKDPVEVAKLAMEMWPETQGTVKDASAIDLTIWREFQELLDWAEPIHTLLNEMSVLTGIPVGHNSKVFDEFQARVPYTISASVEQELSLYLQHKSIL